MPAIAASLQAKFGLAASRLISPTDERWDAEERALSFNIGTTYCVDLYIQNPLRVDDNAEMIPGYMNWYASSISRRTAIGDADAIEQEEERRDYAAARRLFVHEAEVLGYDALVYTNVVESGGDSYIPFRQEQIRGYFGATFGSTGLFRSIN